MKIAIVGNIASGKTTIEKILINKSFKVYDADKIAHKILEESQEIKKAFPNCYNDRKKLGEIVFNNPEKRKLLESLVHPQVIKTIENIKETPVFVSVPLLFEAKMEKIFDKIIFVSAPQQLRMQRLMQRNNLTQAEALARINAQLPEEEKIKKSDYVIDNSSTEDKLEFQIEAVISSLGIKPSII